MKKILKTTICMIILASMLCANASAAPSDISAKSAILYCADTGDVLYEKNADKRMLIASVTKIMTAIVVIENCDLNEQVKLKPEWCAIEGSSMYLDYRKSYTVKELLTGLLLVSGNDAATALACHMSGDERSFSAKMNEKAKELGLKNSSFRNPHGLDDPEHYSTARDLAVLASYCMENEQFREIVSSYSAKIKDQTYYNHNKLLVNYDGCIGLKTGYTIAAGRTLVSCAERNGMRLICVTLSAPDDWDDHKKLLDYGFENYKLSAYSGNSFKLELPIASAAEDTAIAIPENELKLLTLNDDVVDVKLEVPRILFAGGVKGEKVGKLKVFVNGELAAEENLVYTENVPVDSSEHLTAWEHLQRLLNEATKPLYIS